MQLHIQTSTSEMIPISDFHYLYDLARCTKCQMVIVLKDTNKLYATKDDACCIHEVDIPFLINTDLIFRVDLIDKENLYKYKNYFIPDKFNWVILPDYYWNMYINGDIISQYDQESDQNILIDKTTGTVIDQIFVTKERSGADISNFISQLDGYLNRLPLLSTPEYFYNLQNDPNIRKAYDSKAIMGRVLCKMQGKNKNILFYFYKGLFSLSKSDTLDLEIRFDMYNYRLFMATFKPKKKKNPIAFNAYGIPFQERIHCMFINLV